MLHIHTLNKYKQKSYIDCEKHSTALWMIKENFDEKEDV